jgi:phage terminase large subunit-like protein
MPHQQDILYADIRSKIICCGRRWGKTTIGLYMTTLGHGPQDPETGEHKFPGALSGKQVFWVAPTFGISSLIWRQLKYALRDAWVRKLEAERTIFLPGGGSISVKSGENEDAIRGAGLDGVVIDEAAFCSDTLWPEVLRPALADKQGWAIFISTPKGKNYFWEMYQRAEHLEDWERWQRPTSDNPIIPAKEIEAARADTTPLGFRQEFLAEFVTPGGNIVREEWFQYWEPTEDPDVIQLNCTEEGLGTKLVNVKQNLNYMTCDLAASLKTSADYTVFCNWVLAGSDLILLDIDRRRLEGPDQLPAMRQMFERHKPAYIGVERTQYQLTFLQLAKRAGLPARELKTDRDKFSRAQSVAVKFQNLQVYMPIRDPLINIIKDELLSFSGDPASNQHDDIMDNFAYAAMEASYREGGYSTVFGLRRCVKCDTLFHPGPDDNNPRPCVKCGHRPLVLLRR